MKVKIIAVIALVLAGIMVTVTMLRGQAADEAEYAGYLAAARQNADGRTVWLHKWNGRIRKGVK